MKIRANDYKANEIFKFMRESTNKKQREFGEDIGKSKDWVQSNELGRLNFKFKDFLELANKNNIEIYIIDKDENKITTH